MPRIQYFLPEPAPDAPETDWNAFCAAIDSDSDPRETKRPVEDDEWCDEDDYDGDESR